MNILNKVLFIAQVLLILGSLTIFYKSLNYFDVRNRTETAQVAFQSVENQYANILTEAKHALQSWEADIIDHNDGKYCTSSITKILKDDKSYITYGVGDLKGNVICSKSEFPDGYNLNNVTPAYQKVIDQKKFYVTDFGHSTTTKEPRLGVGYPLSDSKGKVVGVLFISIRLDHINDYISKLNLPEKSQLIITDSIGKIEIAYPYDKSLIGEQKFSPTLFSLILSNESGQLQIKESDNRNMLYIYSPFKINEDSDQVSFIVFGIERTKSLLKISSELTLIQITAEIIATGLLIFVVFKLQKTNKKKK
jgi:hypothetical protein